MGKQTVEEILARIDKTVQEPPETEKKTSRLVCAANVKYEPPRWMIKPYFQRGKCTLVQADGGTGKTAFMCAVAAAVSTGQGFLGLKVETPGNVLMVSGEDDEGVLKGRVEASGGDSSKVFFWPRDVEVSFTSPELEEEIAANNIKMVVFDPYQLYLGADVDMNKANETRPVLTKFIEMCNRNDCVGVIIAHIGKGRIGKSPVNMALGTVDLPAAMRSILHLTKSPELPGYVIAIHVKSSNAERGQSIEFSIGERGGVRWQGFVDFDENDLDRENKRKAKGVPYEDEPLVKVFRSLIEENPNGGKWSFAEVKTKGTNLLGYAPFNDSREIGKKLDAGLYQELLQNDGLLVTSGERLTGGRTSGIKIERYSPVKS